VPLKRLSAFRQRLRANPSGKGDFIRNVLTITTGTMISQALTLAAMPVLSRMYSPAAFGLLAIFMVLSNTASQFSCMGYQGAVVLPKQDKSAFTLWAACLSIGFIVSAIALIVVLLNASAIAALLGNPELAEWLWLVPVAMFIWAGFEATSYWCTRKKRFTEISRGVVTNRGSTIAYQLGFGLAKDTSAAGLIDGHVLGSLTGLIIILRQGLQNIPGHYWTGLRLNKAYLLLRRYRHFLGYGLLSNFTAAALRSLPVLVLGFFFSPAIVGLFSMANRLVTAPFQLVTNSLFRVFFERANRAKKDGNLAALTARLYERLIMLLMTPLALLGIAAPDLVVILLGERWAGTSIYLQWLSGWLLFVSAISPLDRLFLIEERQIELASINVLLFVAGLGSLITGGIMGDATLAVAMFCISTTLVRIGQGFRVMKIAGAKTGTVFSAPIRELLFTAPLAGTMLGVIYITESAPIVLAAYVALNVVFVLSRAKSIIKAS
jgi:lipopolysaccharide exporter